MNLVAVITRIISNKTIIQIKETVLANTFFLFSIFFFLTFTTL